jgi:FKBP-type peptidyl-prolyl cis-trans isomerase FkpA
MKLRLQKTAMLAGLIAFSAIAQETKPGTKPPQPPDKEKLSYALGMNLGLLLKQSGVDPDMTVVSQAIKDVIEGKQTEIRQAEIRSILKQAESAARFKQSSKNIAEGEAFLAKNAGTQGINVLPDGLQYRVIQTGTGEIPKKIDILTLKFRGAWINGKEFRHNDHLDMPLWGCPKGLQEALGQMKVGSKWQILVPYNLAFASQEEQAVGFGSTLVYEMELLAAESETARPNQHHSSGRLGHALDEDLLPPKFYSAMDRAQ